MERREALSNGNGYTIKMKRDGMIYIKETHCLIYSSRLVRNGIFLMQTKKVNNNMYPQLKRLIFRASIWRAHNRKCLYCGDLISRLENMEVDHIIPQKYKNQPEEFEKIKEEYELQGDFDINAYYNRAPSHKGCNVKKSYL